MRTSRVFLLVPVLTIIGCSSIDGQPSAGSAPDISEHASSLPFVPSIAERVNDRNDGSTFEPCNELSPSGLIAIGADPSTVADAALSDSPNYRGCHWKSADGVRQYSQIVTNEGSLDAYKAKHSERAWRADEERSGRAVAFAQSGADGCTAVFASQSAVVISLVRTTTMRAPSPGLREECAKAVEFAELAASKAP